jgi:hypothetical protein
MRKNVLIFMQRLRWFTAIKIDKLRAQHMVMLIAKNFMSYFVFFSQLKYRGGSFNQKIETANPAQLS